MASFAISNLDLNQKQLLHAVFHKLTTAPENPVEGQFYYNEDLKAFLYYNGSEWINNGDIPDLSNLYVAVTRIGESNGVAPLNDDIKIDNEYLNIDNTLNAESNNPIANSVIANKIEEIELAKFPNVTVVGNPKIVSGNVSDFSENDYMQFPFTINFYSQPYRINMEFVTNSDITTQQNVLDSTYGIAFAINNGHFVLALSSNGSSWDIGNITGTYNVTTNTVYNIRINWDGTNYTLEYSTDGGETYNTDITINSTLEPSVQTTYIGANPNLWGVGTSHAYLGTINFNGWNIYINSVLRWEGMSDLGLASRANRSLSNLDSIGENTVNTTYDNNAGDRYSWWFGTASEYALITPDNNTLYVVTDANKIYLNGVLLVDKSVSSEVDSELSTTSTNPVQNKIITSALNNKQNVLTGLNATVNELNNTVGSTSNIQAQLNNKSFVSTQNISTLSSGSINLSRLYSYYTYAPTSATTFTFNSGNLNLGSSEIYTFELAINMSSVQTLTFPSNLTWQGDEIPDMNSNGLYFFAFRTINQGSTWVGNLQGIW